MRALDWHPGIGQLPFGTWGAAVLYLLAAYFCWRVARGLRPSGADGRSEAQVWIAIAILFLVLGICRELDIQSVVTNYWRAIARQQGWYANRRVIQPEIISVIGFAFLITSVFVLVVVWSQPQITRLAVAGALWLLTYIAIRAVSFHPVDVLANTRVLGFRWSWILEFTGILVVILAALRRRARLAAAS
jgi:hypothetical protein